MIGRDPRMNVVASGLVRMGTGQEAGGGAGVVTGTIAEGASVVVGQPADHQHIIAYRLQRFENRRGDPVSPCTRRRPLRLVNTIGNEQEYRSKYCIGGRHLAGQSGQRTHRIEPGQRHRRAESA